MRAQHKVEPFNTHRAPTPYSLLITHYSLLITTYYLLLTTYYTYHLLLTLTTYYLLLTTYCLLLTTYYLLLTPHYLPPCQVNIFLLIAAACPWGVCGRKYAAEWGLISFGATSVLILLNALHAVLDSLPPNTNFSHVIWCGPGWTGPMIMRSYMPDSGQQYSYGFWPDASTGWVSDIDALLYVAASVSAVICVLANIRIKKRNNQEVDPTYYLLLTTYYTLYTTHYILHTTHRTLLTTDY
jgi:hypothetical protein